VQFITYAFVSLYARLRSERGQDLLEYALLGGLIAASIVAAITVGILSGALSSMTSQIVNCIDFKSTTVCDIGGP
jgi:Flp pilus assembly pilin Flp